MLNFFCILGRVEKIGKGLNDKCETQVKKTGEEQRNSQLKEASLREVGYVGYA